MATKPENQIITREGPPKTPLAALTRDLQKGHDRLVAALPSHISPEKFQGTILTAVRANPDLLTADRQSLLLSIMKGAQDGLLPDGRESALVIFNNRAKDGQGKWVTVKTVQYMPMVYGLRKKILQSGEVRDITAKVVYLCELERGGFYYEEGTDSQLRHKPDLLMTDEESHDENIIAAYSVATFADGSKSFEVMSRAEINKVRQVSKTGAVGRTDYQSKAIEPKGPWVDWFGEMAKKTVMRRHSKTLPMSGDLIDVEGSEQERNLQAQSTLAALAVEQDAPEPVPGLPSRSDDTQGQTVEQNPTAAFDEETARQIVEALDIAPDAETVGSLRQEWKQSEAGLDRSQNEDIENAFERACKRVGIDPQTGELVEKDAPAPAKKAEPQQDTVSPSEAFTQDIIERAGKATSTVDIMAARGDLKSQAEGMEPEQVTRATAALDAAADRLTAKK